MPIAKRFLSAVMALVMVFGMFSCLGSVTANAGFLEHTVVNGTYTGLNGTGAYMGQVTWKGYRNNEWGLVTTSNFNAYNRAYQNYDNGFGIKSMAELRAEYGNQPFLYLGVEILEDDGELTDHYVEPGQELTLNFYIKSDYYCAGYSSMIFFTRSFFDIDGYDHSRASGKNTKTAGAFWTAATNKNGDGLNSTGYRSSTYCFPEENEDRDYLFTEYLEATATIGDVYNVPSLTVANTGLSQATLNSLSWYMITTNVNAEATDYGFPIDDDSYFYSYTFNVRSEAEPYHKEAQNKAATQFINPFEEYGYIGEIGNDYRLSRDYFSKVTNYYYLTDDEEVESVDALMTFDYGCITDTRDMNHVFMLGEPPVLEEVGVDFASDGSVISSLHTSGYAGDSITLPGADAVSKAGATLVGWSDGTTTYAPGASYTINSAITLNAVWGHTVTYIVNGEEYAVQTYAVGDTIVAPDDPTGDQQFGGWSPALPTTMPDNDITVTATWAAGTYTLTFQREDGSVISSAEVEAGSAITAPEAPAKTGYDFTGWKNVADNSAMPGVMPNGNLTLRATYEAHTYKITYVLNNGQANNVVNYTYGAAVATPAAPAKTGHSFAGWDVTVPATMPAEDLVINAQWTANTYNAEFYIAGESEPYAVVPATFGTAIAMPALPTEEGYSFSAWNPAGTTMDSEGKTYTTTKTANRYTITFYNRDGGTISSGLQTYGQAVQFPTNVPTVAGMTFNGWVNEDGDFVGTTDTVPAKNTSYTASYQGVTHTLTVIIDGNTQTLDRAYGNPLNLETPIKAGYKFTGWLGDDGVVYTSRSTMPDKNLTVTAQFEVQKYKITFDTKGGSEIAAVEGFYGESVPTIGEPTRTGYTFAGWSQAVPATFTEDLTLEAIWNANSYTITWKLNADDAEAYHSITKLYGEDITDADKPADPQVEGSTFNGWDTTVPAKMPARDITIVAMFTTGTYAVTYYTRETESGEYTRFGTDNYSFGQTINVRAKKTQTGWTYSDWEGIPADGKMPAANVNVYSTGTKNIYTDTWYDVDGSVVAEYQVAYGDPIPTVELPSHEGYTGAYWYPNDTVQKAENMSFYYRSQAGSVDYTVEYIVENVDGTYTTTTETRSATTGDRIEATAAMTSRTGYDLDASSVTVIEAVAGNGSSKITIKFNLKSYKIYIKDDANNTVAEYSYKYGQAIQEPTAPEKEGYSFTKWTWTRENGNAINAFPATMPAYNFNGKASYAINTYTITYYVDDVQYGQVESYTYGAAVKAKAEPTKAGASFTGWSPAVPATMPAQNLEIKGYFSTGTFTITYVADGVEVTKVTAAYGADITDRIPQAPEKTGYTFVSWSPAIATMPAENVTVNAVYRINSYNAFFYDAEGGNLLATKKTNYGAQIEAPANPTKVGYEFAGWNETVGTMGAADVTFYATWTAKQYTVTFYAIEGDAAAFATVANVTFGTEFNAPEQNPDRGTAYNFVGWKLAGTSGSATVSFPYTMNAEGLTFVGVWEQNTDSLLIQSVVRVTENYYTRGYAEYDVTLLAGISGDVIYINDGTKTQTYTKATYVMNNGSGAIKSISVNDAGCEVWRISMVLAAAENTYKAYCVTEDGYAESVDNALVFDVTYDTKADDVIAEEFSSYAISANSVVRGEYLTWTFVTANDVDIIKLAGKYELSDGSKKTLTTYYKSGSTSGNVVVSDNANGTRSWSIRMRFTYTALANGDVDLTVTESWTISYKVGNATDYNVANATPVTVVVGKNADALVPATTTYEKYTLISATPAAVNVTKGEYTVVTVVTTDDCSKVRIGTNGKYTTYQTTSRSASTVDADGIRTWTINYKFNADGEYSVNARGDVWGEAMSFDIIAG